MKIDMHCHTSYSYDGNPSPSQVLEIAKNKGLDGVAITEHNNINSWNEYRVCAQKLGMQIIFGEEIKTKQGDILAYFINSPIAKDQEARKTIEEIHKQGGLAIIAHPFHPFEKFKDNPENYLDIIDGIETFNGRCPCSVANKKAFDFTKKYNLPQIAGSDAHIHYSIGDCWTEVLNAKNLDDFKNGIKNKQSIIKTKTSNYIFLIGPLLGKIKHLFKE